MGHWDLELVGAGELFDRRLSVGDLIPLVYTCELLEIFVYVHSS